MLSEDEVKFIKLFTRLKKHLGTSPEGKGMMDLLNACCDRIEELQEELENDIRPTN